MEVIELVHFFMLLSYASCQFQQRQGPPFFETQGPRQNNFGPLTPDLANTRALGLSEQEGQQLINQISQQVLQNIGSTAQIRNFDSPDGINQRFGSFSPSQLSPPGVVPVGLLDGNNINSARSLWGPNGGVNMNDINRGPQISSSFETRDFGRQNNGPFDRQPPLSWNRSPGNMFPEVPIVQSAGNINGPLTGPHNQNARLRQMSNSHVHGDNTHNDPRINSMPQFGHMDRGSLDRLPLDLLDSPANRDNSFPLVIPVNRDPFNARMNPILGIGKALGNALINPLLPKDSLLRQNINDMQRENDKSIIPRSNKYALEDIRRENKRLRKIIKQRKRQLKSKNDDKKKSSRRKNNMTTGLVLGALGALLLG